MNTDKLYLTFVPLIRRVIEPGRRARREHFEAAPPVPGMVVFLGDSITHRGLWDAYLPHLPGINRGIDGDTTEDVLDRLESSIVAPAVVSLLIGTNDLHGDRRLRDVPAIAARTRRIVERIRETAPEAEILLNSVMPRTALLAPTIRALNDLYRQVAADTGCTYIDLWPALASGDDMRRAYTKDGLHLTPAGYLAWADVLRPHLERFSHPLKAVRAGLPTVPRSP